MLMRLWSLLELVGFMVVAYGAWRLSPAWGFIVGGLLMSVWVGVQEFRRDR